MNKDEPILINSETMTNIPIPQETAPEVPTITEVKPIEVAEVKPIEVAEVKPIEVVEVKPIEVAEVKPIEVAEVKPIEVAEVKPIDVAEVKPIEVKSVENTLMEPISVNNSGTYVSKMVEDKINAISKKENVYGVGKVVAVKDFILEVVGLEAVTFNEKVNIENKGVGYVIQMKPTRVSIAVLQKTDKIRVGDSVYQTNELLEGEYSSESFGHVIDLFGNDKLTNKKFSNTMNIPIELETTPIMDRTDVKRPLQTGIAGIDLIYPIGKGQRQLIIGDKKTGKTQICLDTIVNQADKNMICIYVAIGKTKKEVKEIYYDLLKRKANDYTIIITAFYDDLPSILTLTPYFALSVADYYMKNGYDVLVVLDDLKKHADAYRQICLISGKSPGRDAYPADIFYFHSRLLERGCQYKDGGSITILPVMETKSGDITDYISTNIISITDGQIVLSREAFIRGEKPAINYGLSVSRLGGSVQEQSMKVLGASVRQTLLSYLETRAVYELANEDEMSKELQEKLFKGKNILNALLQYKFNPLTKEQIIQRFTEVTQVAGSPAEASQTVAPQPTQAQPAQPQAQTVAPQPTQATVQQPAQAVVQQPSQPAVQQPVQNPVPEIAK